MTPRYSVIVPVFNEEAVVGECYRRLTEVLSNLDAPWEILFVNDGSRDSSGDIIRQLAQRDPHVQLIDFARNFGHQIAITAGCHKARGEAIVVIDADLQDPPEVIPEMIGKWKEGFEVVYGKRAKRNGESLFKKMTSTFYYRLLRKLTDVSIPVDVGDFRLIDRKVCDAYNQLKEKNRYVRGLISWLGFSQAEVTFNRAARFAGVTKYPLRKMIKFALDGMFAFSAKPLKMAMGPGFLMAFAGFAYFLYVLYLKFFTVKTELGWPSLMSAILFFNGYTLIMIGVLGEYLGRLFEEAKGRPLYIVREVLFQDVPEK
jgi:dolichol-phosphate mannosyltransferase